MAQAGFKTWTENGVLQLDANYDNYSLLKKVKVTCQGNIFFSMGYGYADVQVKSQHPIFVALKGTYIGQKVFLHYVTKSNDTYTARVIGNVNSEVEVYIYSKAPVYKSKNGLNIYKENGEIAFSSEVPYLWLDNIVYVDASIYGGQVIKSTNENDQIAICVPPMFSYCNTYINIEIGSFTYSPFQTNPLIYQGDYYQLTVNRENIFLETHGNPIADNYLLFGSFVLVDIRNTLSINWEVA